MSLFLKKACGHGREDPARGQADLLQIPHMSQVTLCGGRLAYFLSPGLHRDSLPLGMGVIIRRFPYPSAADMLLSDCNTEPLTLAQECFLANK